VEGERLRCMNSLRWSPHGRSRLTLCCSSYLQNFSVTLANMVWDDNKVDFKVQLEHRESWEFSQARDAAELEFYETVKKLREDLGLTFVRSAQPVAVHRPGAHKPGEGQGRLSTDTADLYEAQVQAECTRHSRDSVRTDVSTISTNSAVKRA
jgi:hypothetical protein